MGEAARLRREVTVWLFGELAKVAPERPLRLDLGDTITSGGVVAELVDRYGNDFRDRVLEPDGRLKGCCRISIDGELIDDLDLPIPVPANGTEMEFILLWATEGG